MRIIVLQATILLCDLGPKVSVFNQSDGYKKKNLKFKKPNLKREINIRHYLHFNDRIIIHLCELK